MADRRMFSKSIVESDAFTRMPLSAQALYFHLLANADDDGFLGNALGIQRLIGANDDDLRILAARKFIIAFESGVIVIKHWKINNLIRKDRYRETNYRDEKTALRVRDNGTYFTVSPDETPSGNHLTTNGIPSGNHLATNGIPSGNQRLTQVRLGKDRLGKDSNTLSGKPDCTDEVIGYLNERTGKQFKPSSKKTQTLIRARLSDGFTPDDFRTVIDNKCAEWLCDSSMNRFLRPETLFGTKFEGYLNEKSTSPEKSERSERYARYR